MMSRYLVDYMDACELLKRNKIAVVHSTYVSSPEEAIAFLHGPILQNRPFPLTLKVISPKVPAKSSKGFVLVGLQGDVAIRRAYNELVAAAAPYTPFKILAQPTVEGRPLRLTVGSRTNRKGVQTLFLGLLPHEGRSITELTERPIPVNAAIAESMVRGLHSAHAIALRARDLAMLTHFLVKVSRMVDRNKIVELHLNPVILHENQYTVVDIKMFLEHPKIRLSKHFRSKKPAQGDRNRMSLEHSAGSRRAVSAQKKATPANS
jgi:hypothetical protein